MVENEDTVAVPVEVLRGVVANSIVFMSRVTFEVLWAHEHGER